MRVRPALLAVLALIVPACHRDRDRVASLSLFSDFGTGGAVTINPSTSGDPAISIAIDATSMYVVGGDVAAGSEQWRIEKRSLTTGAFDAVFGGGTGVVQNNPSGGNEDAFAIAIDSTSMFVGGNDFVTGVSRIRIEKRSLTTGALDGVFGGGTGIITSAPSGIEETVMALAIDAVSMYVVGYEAVAAGNHQWRVEKRSLSTGALDGVFGGGTGAVVSNPSATSDLTTGIALDATSMYVVGFDRALGDVQWRIEKRSLTTGALDGTFGGGTGIVTVNPSPNEDFANEVAVDGTSIYVVGWDRISGPATKRGRIEKRSLATGVLDATFGGGTGIIATDVGAGGEDQWTGIVLDGSVMYLGGADDAPGDGEWRIEKRAVADGTLLAVATSNPTTGQDQIGRPGGSPLAVDASAVYAVGIDFDSGNHQWRIEKRTK